MKYTKLKKMINTNLLKRVSAGVTALAVFVTQTGIAAFLTFIPVGVEAETSSGVRSVGQLKEILKTSTEDNEELNFEVDFSFDSKGVVVPMRFVWNLFDNGRKVVFFKEGPFQEKLDPAYQGAYWENVIGDTIFGPKAVTTTKTLPQKPQPLSPGGKSINTGDIVLKATGVDPSVPEAAPVVYRYQVQNAKSDSNQVYRKLSDNPKLNWTQTDNPQPLNTDGMYQWSVQACDQTVNFAAQQNYINKTGKYRPFNHCSDWSETLTFGVDQTSPEVSFNSPKQDGAYVSGKLSFIGSAIDKPNNGIASGVKETKLLVKKGEKVVSKIAKQEERFIWDTTTVPDGKYTVLLQAKDKAGNIGESKKYTFTVDNEDPGVTITEPVATEQEKQSTAYLNSWNGTISGKTTGDVENVNLQIVRTQDESKQVWNGVGWMPYNETVDIQVEANGVEQWQYNLKNKTDVVDAEYTVTAEATEEYHIEPDPTVASDEETFVYDTTAPKQENISLTSPTQETKYISEKITLTGKVEEGAESIQDQDASFVISAKNGEKKKTIPAQKQKNSRTYQAQWDTTGVDDGNYIIKFKVLDRAGNATTTKDRIVTVDNTDAQVQITTPTSETENGIVYTNQWDGSIEGTISGDVKTLELVAQKTELDSSEDITYVWNPETEEWESVDSTNTLPRIKLQEQLQANGDWQFVLPEQARMENSRFSIQAFVTEEYSQKEDNEQSSKIVNVQYDTKQPQGSWSVEQISEKEVQVSWEVIDASGIESYVLKTTNPNGKTSQQSFKPQVTSTKIATKNSGDWQFSLQAKDRAGNTKTFSDSTVQIAIEENSSENKEQSDQNTEGGSNTDESTQDNSDTDSSNTGAEQDKNANEESNSSEGEDQSSTDDSQQSKEKETSETDTESDTTQEESTQQNDQSSSDNDSQSDSSENSQDKNANEGNVTIPKEEPQSETDTEESEEDQPTNEDTSSNEESQSSDSQSPEEDNNSSSDTSDESTEEEQRGSSEDNTSGTEESGTEEQSSSFQNQEVALEPEASSNTTTTTDSDSEDNSTENESESNAETIYTGSAAESSNEQSSEQEGTPVLQARLVDFVQNSWPYLLFIFVVALIGYGIYRGRNENSS